MNIRQIGIASLLSVVVLNVWAGAGGAAPKSNAKASYDVTGTWIARIEGGRGPALSMEFVLKQDGEKITGTVATNGGTPIEISDGKAELSAAHFSVKTTMPPMQMPGQPPNPNAKPMELVTKYTAKVSGNDMELTQQMQMPGGMGGMPMGGGMGGGGRMGGGMGGGGMGGGMPMGGGMGGGPGGTNAPIKAHRQ